MLAKRNVQRIEGGTPQLSDFFRFLPLTNVVDGEVGVEEGD